MELAEKDREGHEEGANEILPGDTFSDSVLALLPGRIASSASLPSRPRWSTPQAPSLGGPRMERSCCRPGQDVGGGVEPVCVADRWHVG